MKKYLLPFLSIVLLVLAVIGWQKYLVLKRKAQKNVTNAATTLTIQSFAGKKSITASLHPWYLSINSTDFDNGKPLLKVRMMNRPAPESKLTMLRTIDRILKERYNVIYVDDNNYDLVIDSMFGKIQPKINSSGLNVAYEIIENLNAVKIFYIEEAVRPLIERYDLSIAMDHIDDHRYIRVPYAYINSFNHSFSVEQISAKYDRTKDFGRCLTKTHLHSQPKQFACFLVGNGSGGEGAVMRVRLFHKLSLYKNVLSGGPYLNNVGGAIPFEGTKDFLSKCKFVIAYENQSYDGYITEKVYQAYFNGAIPIYYGHPNVFEDINKKAVIYSGDFDDEDALVEYIKKVDQDDKLYCDIWKEPLVNNPEKDYEAVYAKLRDKIFEVIDNKLSKKH